MSIESVESKRLDHHGIVAGIIADLGLIQEIDERVPAYGQEKISVGQAVAGMIVNGLGFSDRPLYLTPQFFEQLPTEKLFGAEVYPEDFNRFRLSRSLDALYDAGLTKIFSEVAAICAAKEGVDRKFQALDTTSFSLSGEYDCDSDTQGIIVTKGFSKDHRPDLNQFVTELIVTHDSGIPMSFQCHDGNASDSNIFRDRCQKLVELFDGEQLLVADSKLYTEDNARNLCQLSFVTRIPETLNVAKNAITVALSQANRWHLLIQSDSERENIRYYTHQLEHYGMRQLWIIAYSDESVAKAKHTLKKAADKERTEVEKSLFHLQARRFACKEDAIAALAAIEKKTKLVVLSDFEVVEHARYTLRGRPQAGSSAEKIEFQILATAKGTIDLDEKAKRKACFIVGSNKLSITPEDLLQTYKEQGHVERGFRFLKDPLFFASSFFLKTPKRIEALTMVMTLALLVYSIAQRRLRRSLAAANETIPNQINLPTKTPTMRWVFQLFWGINSIQLKMNNELRSMIQGLKEQHELILKHLGGAALKIYSQ